LIKKNCKINDDKNIVKMPLEIDKEKMFEWVEKKV
jgi:hypothetical protein